ncbi:reverse transcriptase-like protein [Actinomadura sp. J1-007]|nr:reverse transcriptase-like protein [Actinomadura sp. J1-007]
MPGLPPRAQHRRRQPHPGRGRRRGHPLRGVPPHPRPHPRVGPVTRRLVIEADGGSRGNPGPAGYGALVRDALTGEVLAEVAESIGHATNNVAEYRGLIAGLRAVAEIDPSARVEVRMDSKLVVEQMSGRWKIKHPDMVPLALEARDLASELGPVSYGWIPRDRNAHADRLANEAMDAAARGEHWVRKIEEDPPADGPAPDREATSDRAAAQARDGADSEAPGWSTATSAPRGRCCCGTARRRCRRRSGSRGSASSR